MNAQGPNVRKLIVAKMTLILVPPGTAKRPLAGVAAVVEALSLPGRLSAAAGQATDWAAAAIAAVKAAPGNLWGDDDEAIAGEILRMVQEKKSARMEGRGGDVRAGQEAYPTKSPSGNAAAAT